jgi:hypothetical protein
MDDFKIMKSSVFLFALALGTAATSWAGVTSCTGQSLATLLSAGGNTPADGCGQIDLGFNNFTTPTSTGTNAGPTTGQVDLTTSGGTATPATTEAPITALFGFTGGNSLTTSATSDTISSSFQDLGKPAAGQALPSDPPDQWAVNGLGLTFAATSSATPASLETVQVVEAFCLGSTTFTCATNTSSYGYLQITENVNTNGTNTYSDVLCTPGATGCTTTNPTTSSLSIAVANSLEVATQSSFTMSRTSGSGNTITLNSISETWDQGEIAPEPSTFILLGSALAGIGALRLRIRKHF